MDIKDIEYLCLFLGVAVTLFQNNRTFCRKCFVFSNL